MFSCKTIYEKVPIKCDVRTTTKITLCSYPYLFRFYILSQLRYYFRGNIHFLGVIENGLCHGNKLFEYWFFYQNLYILELMIFVLKYTAL